MDIRLPDVEHNKINKIFDEIEFGKVPGTVNRDDARFLAQTILDAAPKNYLEIGVASGASALAAAAVSSTFATNIVAIDADIHWYADRTKAVGYLLDTDLLSSEDRSRIDLRVGTRLYDGIDELQSGPRFEMIFIDADHAHPWPTVDTIFALTIASDNCVFVHHDLSLYMTSESHERTGPKFLYDQIPENYRNQALYPFKPSIFSFRYNEESKIAIHQACAKSLYLPWSGDVTINNDFVTRLETMAETLKAVTIQDALRECWQRYRIS